MSAKFYLKPTPGSDQSSIFYSVCIFGFRARRSTGIKIRPTDWDSKKLRVKSTTRQSLKINAFLSELVSKTDRAKIDFITSFEIPTPEQFLTAVFGQSKGRDEDILTLFHNFILRQKRKHDNSGYKVYQSAFNNLLKFNPLLKVITGPVLDDFSEWLIEQKYSPNYAKKQVNCLRYFALASGMSVDQKIKIQNKKSDKIALSLEEIAAIETVAITERTLANARDIFVFACWTGLRYSDIQAFSKTNIQVISGVRCISIYSKKTQTKSVIPIFPPVQKILDRYGGILPRRLSGQKFNDAIKQVCKIAGLVQGVQVAKLEGNQKRIITMKKYAAISSHTARRSFVTIMSIMGLTSKEISSMTGHSQTRIVEIYDKTKAEQNAVKVFGILNDRI